MAYLKFRLCRANSKHEKTPEAFRPPGVKFSGVQRASAHSYRPGRSIPHSRPWFVCGVLSVPSQLPLRIRLSLKHSAMLLAPVVSDYPGRFVRFHVPITNPPRGSRQAPPVDFFSFSSERLFQLLELPVRRHERLSHTLYRRTPEALGVRVGELDPERLLTGTDATGFRLVRLDCVVRHDENIAQPPSIV